MEEGGKKKRSKRHELQAETSVLERKGEGQHEQLLGSEQMFKSGPQARQSRTAFVHQQRRLAPSCNQMERLERVNPVFNPVLVH